MRYLPLILIVACMNLAAQPGYAAANSIKDCEKIQAADAYNLCLASFGPVAREHELKPVPAGIGTGKRYSGHHHNHRARYRHRSGVKVSRQGHRKRMQLSVGTRGPLD